VPIIFFENDLFGGNFRGISADYTVDIIGENLEFLRKFLRAPNLSRKFFDFMRHSTLLHD
jgi:hypothetical protein